MRNYVKAMVKSSEHLLSLINDILDLSKIESGTLSIRNLRLYLKDIADDLMQMFKLRCAEKNIHFVISIDQAENIFSGDSTRIALSACGLTEEIEEAFKVGCDDYLVKPAKKEVILNLIKSRITNL